jgi:hypothetical protein
MKALRARNSDRISNALVVTDINRQDLLPGKSRLLDLFWFRCGDNNVVTLRCQYVGERAADSSDTAKN